MYHEDHLEHHVLMSFIHGSTSRMANFFKRTPYRYTIGALLILVIAIAVTLHFINKVPQMPAIASESPQVTLESVASLSSDSSALPVTGAVSSLHQATILAQSAGAVTAVNASIGSAVAAGQVIARLENSGQYAAVEQARGAYDAAQASYAKASGTTAENTTASAVQAGVAVQNAQAAAAAALQSAYTALDDAVQTKSDPLFSNPRSNNPSLIGMTSPDSQLVISVQNERIALNATLADARSRASGAASGNIDANIAGMQADTQIVVSFLSDLLRLVNGAVPNQTITSSAIAGYQASISAARSEVVGIAASLTSAKNAYDTAVSAASTATNTASGGTASDIAIAKANVEQAQGALNAAQSNLEKTIIRSPLSGTIVNLPIKQGDFITAYSVAAIVSNASALEVVTHVTASDAKTLSVAGKATIGASATGVITSIAPALDPVTNEIEVHIGITSGAKTLTDGESVTVDLVRSTARSAAKPTKSAPTVISIPIIALKITPSGPVVFSVSASSTLVAHAITLGSILGDHVAVMSGITPDMTIVEDARGHVSGDVVVVDAK